jgi:hypothetical protein
MFKRDLAGFRNADKINKRLSCILFHLTANWTYRQDEIENTNW